MLILEKCSKIYNNGCVGIRNVNITFPSTGFIGIVGKSGSGKSTLLNCLSGLDSFTEGDIFLDGKKVNDLYEYSTYVFQEHKLIEDFTIFDNISIICSKSDTLKIDDLLKKFGLFELKYNKVNAISGGQRQRVEIIRAYLQNSSVIFLDEPTANLDEESSKIVFEMLKEISGERLVIIVSHNQDLLSLYTTDLIYIDNNEIVNNTIEYGHSFSNYTPLLNRKLSWIFSFRLSLNNILANKFKSIMTLVFVVIATFLMSLIFTIVNVDLDYVLFNANTIHDVNYVRYMPKNESNYYPEMYGYVSDSVIENVNPDIISYENVNFKCVYDENITYFNNIWVTDKYEDYVLDNLEVLVNINELYEINKTISYNEYELVIKRIVQSDFNNLIIMNQNTFNLICDNLLENNKTKIYTPSGLALVTVYTKYENADVECISGVVPQKDSEIALPFNLLERLGNYSVGDEIIVSFSKKGQVLTESFILTGVTKNYLVICDSFEHEFLMQYGVESLDANARGIIFVDYTYNDFKNATDNGLAMIGNISNSVYSVYNSFSNIMPILLFLLVIFMVVSVFSIYNNVNTNIIKNKKNIGILVSMKIKVISLFKIYLIENFIISLLAIIISLFCYEPVLMKLNDLYCNSYFIEILYLYPRYEIMFIVFICLMLVVILGIFIPLNKMLRKNNIDLLFER